MRAALRWLTGGPVPGPSWILAAVLLVSCFLAAAAPRVLGTVQTRVLQQTVTHAGPLDSGRGADRLGDQPGLRPGPGAAGQHAPGGWKQSSGRRSSRSPAPAGPA